MSVSILRIKDKDGKWIPIEAIKGDDGLTPYIKYATWWIGDIDTGVRAEVQESTLMATGSYVGTGTETVSLNFDFEPKILIIPSVPAMFTPAASNVISLSQETGLERYYNLKLIIGAAADFSDNSVTIYFNSDTYRVSAILNKAGKTYRYIALGNGILLDGDEVEY